MLTSMRQNTISGDVIVSARKRTQVWVAENRNIDATAMMTPVNIVDEAGLGEEPP